MAINFKIKFLLKKQFYEYLFYKLKRSKPFDAIFFDWATFFILLGIFLIGLLLLFPQRVTLAIPPKESQLYMVEAILRNLSLFVGITFSFIFLSFNIFYRYFGRFAFIAFFKNRAARICLTLIVCTICLCIYATAYLREIAISNKFGNFLYLLCIGLAIVSFFSIFPSLILLLRKSQSRENIRELFNNLNADWSYEEWKARVVDKSLDKFYHKDPITVLTEIGITSIREFDNKTILVICKTCKEFFQDNTRRIIAKETAIDSNTLYYEFKGLLMNLFQLSVKERNETASIMIQRARFHLEYIVINNLSNDAAKEFTDTEGKYMHWTLDFDMTDAFKRAIHFNEDEVARTIIDNYRDFCVSSIPILMPKNFKYNQALHFESAREAEIIFSPLRKVADLVPEIVETNKYTLFKSVFTLFYCIESKVLDLDIDSASKCFLLNIIHNYKYPVFNQYVSMNSVQHIDYLNFPFSNNDRFFEKTGCKSHYRQGLTVLSLLLSKGKLNTVVINQFKAEMLGLIRLMPANKDAEVLLFNTSDKFIELAKTVSKDDTDERKDVYLKLAKYLGIVQISLDEVNGIGQDTKEKFREILKSFVHKETFEKELAEKGYVSDESII